MMRTLYNWLLAFIVPPYCRSCRIFLPARTIFCVSCFTKIRPLVTKDHAITARRIMRVFAIGAYEEPLRSLITAKLYSDISAGSEIAQLMVKLINFNCIAFDYIVPVPLHWTRYAKRGFNQAEEIARELARLTNKPMIHLVKRVRRTEYQSKLDANQRKTNVSGAFALRYDAEKYKHKRLLLVDDLYTTGSTIHAVARELLTINPISIDLVVACRTV